MCTLAPPIIHGHAFRGEKTRALLSSYARLETLRHQPAQWMLMRRRGESETGVNCSLGERSYIMSGSRRIKVWRGLVMLSTLRLRRALFRKAERREKRGRARAKKKEGADKLRRGHERVNHHMGAEQLHGEENTITSIYITKKETKGNGTTTNFWTQILTSFVFFF